MQRGHRQVEVNLYGLEGLNRVGIAAKGDDDSLPHGAVCAGRFNDLVVGLTFDSQSAYEHGGGLRLPS
jgi:hypothetical protein